MEIGNKQALVIPEQMTTKSYVHTHDFGFKKNGSAEATRNKIPPINIIQPVVDKSSSWESLELTEGKKAKTIPNAIQNEYIRQRIIRYT